MQKHPQVGFRKSITTRRTRQIDAIKRQAALQYPKAWKTKALLILNPLEDDSSNK